MVRDGEIGQRFPSAAAREFHPVACLRDVKTISTVISSSFNVGCENVKGADKVRTSKGAVKTDVDETWYTDATSQEDDKKVIKSVGHRAHFDITMLTNMAI